MTSKAYFDRVAPEWETMRASFFSEAVREKAFSLVPLAEGQRAADLGAGSGFITEGLLGRGLRVIAVDQSEAMLHALIGRLEGNSRVETRVGDAEHLPLADGEVDCVFANMFLHHVEHPPIALQEMARVVRRGGAVVVSDMDEHHYDFLLSEQHDRWPGFPRQSIQDWFQAAGLIDVRVECTGESCSARSTREDQIAAVSLFVAFGRKPET